MTRLPLIAIAFVGLLVAATLSAQDTTAAPSLSEPPATFTGIICVDADCQTAGAGMELVAKVGDVECARTTIFSISDGPTQTRYDISVPSDAEVPGCGTESEIVAFFVDGRPASNGGIWRAGQTENLDNWVGENFAAFSGALSRNGQPIEVTGGGGFYVGPNVRAYIGGVLCGEKQAIQGVPGQAHYSLLVIPSSRPGCEVNDATVTFTVDNVPADQTDRNVYGFLNRDLNITVSDTPTPSPSPSPSPPPTGTVTSGFSGGMCIDLRCNAIGTVTASINGTACGKGNLSHADFFSGRPPAYFYGISVASAQTTPGCGTEGATIQFAIDGRPAVPNGTWHAGSSQTLTLIVGEPFAQFSGTVSLNNSPLPTTTVWTVKAFMAGVECASGEVTHGLNRDVLSDSFYSVIIPAYSGRPGCGTQGAPITFTINGIAADQITAFHTGLYTIPLSADLPTSPPNDGGPPADRSTQPWLIATALALLAASAITFTAAHRKPRTAATP